MESINKIRKLSLWIFIIPFIGINACLILITNFHQFFNLEDIVLPTIPYIDGGTSISRTARVFPTYLIFKPAMFITSFLLVLAFPPLEAAGIFQLMDRVFGTSFFLPSGLVISGQALDVSGGGSPLLWQHLFWFLAHPEVYVLILPGMGVIAEVIANNTRNLYGDINP